MCPDSALRVDSKPGELCQMVTAKLCVQACLQYQARLTLEQSGLRCLYHHLRQRLVRFVGQQLVCKWGGGRG